MGLGCHLAALNPCCVVFANDQDLLLFLKERLELERLSKGMLLHGRTIALVVTTLLISPTGAAILLL